MAGSFEVFVDADALYRFRLLAPDGTVMAVSQGFGDKRAVAAGIAAVRECAGTGLVTDLCPAGAAARPVPGAVPADAVPECGHQTPVRAHTFTPAKGPRRLAATPRWTRALAP
jgi:uncharacterized protein YegP (UPF0339 family)